ncbi:MAG: beta-L-arabinofuranosidase domain-containing protein, partial [Marinilabiliaceae bacterium]|nr:beta-L-arabinofuranosidase domain-containing protein [Marinilabiliaceae bacterium]
ETCAAIANVFWNYRLFLTHGEAKYMDIVERSMYNNVLSGISLEGNKFFYPNRLESRGGVERSEWFNVSCCPTNITRFIPSVPGYIYATKDDELYVNLYISSQAGVELNSTPLTLIQDSDLPWGGRVSISLDTEKDVYFKLRARLPAWASDRPVTSDLYSFEKNVSESPQIRVNNSIIEYTVVDGYMLIDRVWNKGDRVDITFPFEIRKLHAHDSVLANRGKVALQAGPLVYAAEWPDQEDGKVLNLVLDDKNDLSFGSAEIMGNRIMTIEGSGRSLKLNRDESLESKKVDITAVPYFAWAHRGDREMAVWIPIRDEAAVPLHYPTIASESRIEASHPKAQLKSIQDHRIPENSGSREETNFNWWPLKDTTGWISYEFAKPERISECEIFWFTDAYRGGGVGMPESWKICYRKGNIWLPVTAVSDYEIKKDEISRVRFEAVRTDALRLEVLMGEKSAGLYEWTVK